MNRLSIIGFVFSRTGIRTFAVSFSEQIPC